MFNLPKSTEINKVLAKTKLFEKSSLSAKERDVFDNDISRLYITHEISPRTLAIEKSEDISAIFIVSAQLKHKDFDIKNIALLTKLIPQKMLIALEYENEVKLSLCLPQVHNKILQTDWKKANDVHIELKGNTLKTVWEQFILDIGNIELAEENTIEEQIELNAEHEKLFKKIEQLEKKARAEKQPKKKFEILEEVKKLKGEMQ